jgi:hypothetical protein
MFNFARVRQECVALTKGGGFFAIYQLFEVRTLPALAKSGPNTLGMKKHLGSR